MNIVKTEGTDARITVKIDRTWQMIKEKATMVYWKEFSCQHY